MVLTLTTMCSVVCTTPFMHVLIAVTIPPYSRKMLLAAEFKVYITSFSHLVSPYNKYDL